MSLQLTEFLNTFYTTTWAKRRTGIVDQIFEKNKLLLVLNSKGMVHYENTDGSRLEIPLAIIRSGTSKFFGKGAVFTVSDFDPLTVAYDTWKNFGDQMVRYWVDDKANGGSKTAHIKMLRTKINILKESLNTDLEDALWSTSGGSSTLAYNGIPYLIDASPSTSKVVHGLNQATLTDGAGNFIWRNQQKTATGAFSLYGESDMTNLYNTCSRWGSTDVLISDQTTYELGETEALERVQVVNKEAVSLGLDHITFKGKMWFWSPKCATGYTYFIDREHLGFTIDPDVNFTMGAWKPIPQQYNDFVTQIVQRGNAWTDKRRCHGVLTGQHS